MYPVQKMHHPIVGQGGFNVARRVPMGGYNAIIREPIAGQQHPIVGGQERTQAVAERNLTELMAGLGVGAPVLSTDIMPQGLRLAMVQHGQDLQQILENGGLMEQSRHVKLGDRDLKEIITNLRHIICKCADAGFCHLDIKSPNIVVRRGSRGELNVRLIDWDSHFITNIEKDAMLLQELETWSVQSPCEVLRCTYCIIMWTLFTAYLKTYTNTPLGRILATMAEEQLDTCKINGVIRNLLIHSKTPSLLKRLIDLFVGNYLEMTAETVLNDLDFTIIEPSVAFGVAYDSPTVSASTPSKQRGVFGNFSQCPPPPSQASSTFSILSRPSWDRPEQTRISREVQRRTATEAQAGMDAHAERQRAKNSLRRKKKGQQERDRGVKAYIDRKRPHRSRSHRRSPQNSNRRSRSHQRSPRNSNTY